MHIETERKFLISLPCEDELEGYAKKEITQTYLTIDDGMGGERRVRAIAEDGETKYIYTEKRKITDVSRYEDESEITREEYDRLIDEADEPRELTKTRYIVPHDGHVFEIDVYPREIGGDALDGKAVLEIELSSESQEFDFPPFIKVERELTGQREFSNKSLARRIFR